MRRQLGYREKYREAWRKVSRGVNGKHDFHDQPAVRGIGGGHSSVMQPHGALGDGETDPGPALLAVAGVGHPIEGEKQPGKRVRGNAGTVVPNLDGQAWSPSDPRRTGRLGGSTWECSGAVVDGVAHHVLNGSPEHLFGTGER